MSDRTTAQELFRREALDAQRGSSLGEIALTQPLRPALLSIAAILAAAAIVLLLVFGTYTRRWRVEGQLVPVNGLVAVSAPIAGVLTRVDVQEGAGVGSGTVLAVVAAPGATLLSEDTGSALEGRLAERAAGLRSARQAERATLQAKAEGTARQLAIAKKELSEIERLSATRAEQVRLARETLARWRQLQREKHVSDLQVRQQEDLALEKVAEVQVLERDATATRRTIAQLEQSLEEARGQGLMADATLEGNLAALEQERLQARIQRELVITTPVAGVVATQLAKLGQAVQPGQVLFTVVPGDGALEAQLLVPSRAIGPIKPGAEVLLRYDAYPYQQFGYATGKVRAVSRSALGANEQAALSGIPAAGEQRYRVSVALARQSIDVHGQAEPLTPGMLLQADIIGERRRLISWLADPLASLRAKVGPE
ncbi:HlyD family secretion protein [Tahibacter harae]|uniref:HlyD family secretion protein n=1 Tax=Tahibacter harae TaxID=2963937 RepID=A0ABT1QVQ1_9GAMM|nr:HlyD family secretion protein [Tahibacter harae]